MNTTLKSKIIEVTVLLAKEILKRTYLPTAQPKLQCRYCRMKSKVKIYQDKRWHYYCGRHEKAEIVLHMVEIVTASFSVVKVVTLMPPIKQKVSP